MKLEMPELADIRSRFRRKPERIGVELEGRSVRVVRSARSEGGDRKVISFDELDIDLWKADSLEQQRFKALIRQRAGEMTKVAVNIEHPTLRIRRMNLPKMPELDMLEAIRWNFREQIEVPIEKYLVGYTMLDLPPDGNKLPLIAFGVAEQAVTDLEMLFKNLGLKLISIEPAATALLAAFSANGVLSDGKHHVCIMFGDSISYFLVMKGNSVLFSRPLAGISRAGLAGHLMQNMGLEEQTAFASIDMWAKRSRLQDQEVNDFDERVDANVKIFYSRFAIEVQRSIDAFCIMYACEGVDSIHLCGRGVEMPGMAVGLQRTVGIETKLFDPFEKLLDPKFKTDEITARSPMFSVAVGLSIP